MPAQLFRAPIGEPEIAKIAALADPVLRNLWIRRRPRLRRGHGAPRRARQYLWPAFATWASRTAGARFRGEVFHSRIGTCSAVLGLPAGGGARQGPLSGTAVREIDWTSSTPSGGGGRGESADRARETSRCSRSSGRSSRAWCHLRRPGPGDPARRAALIAWVQALDGRRGGDRPAADRLRAVLRPCSMPSATRGLTRILLANGLAGLTEQIRLQPISRVPSTPHRDEPWRVARGTVAKLPERSRDGARLALRLVGHRDRGGMAPRRTEL